MPELIPMRWPAAWTDASKLDLLKGTPINCLAGDTPPPFPLGDLQFVKPEQRTGGNCCARGRLARSSRVAAEFEPRRGAARYPAGTGEDDLAGTSTARR